MRNLWVFGDVPKGDTPDSKRSSSPVKSQTLVVHNWSSNQSKNMRFVLDYLNVDKEAIVLNMGSGNNPIVISERPNIFNVDSQISVSRHAAVIARPLGGKPWDVDFFETSKIRKVLEEVPEGDKGISVIVWYNLPFFIRHYADSSSIWQEVSERLRQKQKAFDGFEVLSGPEGESYDEIEKEAFLNPMAVY